MGHYAADVETRVSAIDRSLSTQRAPVTGGIGGIGRIVGLVGLVGSLPVVALGAAAVLTPVLLRATAVDAPALRAALEMMMTLFALAAAWLLRVEFASSGRLGDLLLLAATLVLGLINLGVAALPAALDLRAGPQFAAAGVCGLLFVAAVFALAAFAPTDWLLTGRRHPLAIGVGLSLAGLATAALGGILVGTRGDVAFGDPALLVLMVCAAGLLLQAALGFAGRQRFSQGAGPGLMAIATTLLAAASVSNALGGSMAPGRVGASEALRVLAFALILSAAVVAEREVHARISKATALAERLRVARDLHDGIAQDLAFIAAHGTRFADELGDEHPVVVAARRALAISRSTISELADPAGATADEALGALAHELGERFDIAISVNSELNGDLESHELEHVTRIAREAIANAARHGRARNVVVSLRHTHTGMALRVLDDGCGIMGPERSQAPEGFGLRSMRERTAELGGQLNVRQPRTGGTELEVVLP